MEKYNSKFKRKVLKESSKLLFYFQESAGDQIFCIDDKSGNLLYKLRLDRANRIIYNTEFKLDDIFDASSGKGIWYESNTDENKSCTWKYSGGKLEVQFEIDGQPIVRTIIIKDEVEYDGTCIIK